VVVDLDQLAIGREALQLVLGDVLHVAGHGERDLHQVRRHLEANDSLFVVAELEVRVGSRNLGAADVVLDLKCDLAVFEEAGTRLLAVDQELCSDHDLGLLANEELFAVGVEESFEII
jgi:hypothetical protein